jgi:hypothetical protein
MSRGLQSVRTCAPHLDLTGQRDIAGTEAPAVMAAGT